MSFYQPIPFDSAIDLFFESLKSVPACAWCKYPHKAVMKRTGLCRHCNYIKKQMTRLEARIARDKAKFGKGGTTLEYQYRWLCKKAELCKAEGQVYSILRASPNSIWSMS